MKRITTKLTLDMNTGEVIEHQWFWYSGTIAEAKGGASRAEQSAADEQRALQNQLMQQQLAMQQRQIGMANPVLQSIISAGGLLPGTENALRASYLNTLPQTYRAGIAQVNNNLAARGLTGGQYGAGSGDVAKQFGLMQALLGQQQQQGETDLQLSKAQGLNQALNTTLGIGGMYGQNVGTFNRGASDALNSGVNAAHNVDEASSSWFGPVFGALGSLGGASINKWCWVASECYGSWYDPRVQFIRERLGYRASREIKYAAIAGAYRIFGKAVAAMVRRSAYLKRGFTSLFDKFIAREMNAVLNELVTQQ